MGLKPGTARASDRVQTEGLAIGDESVVFGGGGNTHIYNLVQDQFYESFSQGSTESVDLTTNYVLYGDGDVYVHDVTDGSLVHTSTEQSFTTYGVALTDTHFIHSGSDDTVYFQSLSDGNVTTTKTAPDNVEGHFSANSNYIAVGDVAGSVYVWENNSPNFPLVNSFQPETNAIFGVDLNGQEIGIAYDSATPNCYIYDVETTNQVASFSQLSGLEDVALTDDFIAYGGGDVAVHDRSDNSLLYTFTDQSFTTYAVAVEKDRAATCGSDDDCYIYDLNTGNLVNTITDPGGNDLFGVALYIG